MKKRYIALTVLMMALSGCSASEKAEAEKKEVIVFAAASLTEAITEIAEKYEAVEADVDVIYNFDSSGKLKTQIEEGADCDIFISAAQKQMNELDNVDEQTRFDIVSNSVVLITPEGNPAGIESFDDVAGEKVSLIALGNSDVPVGQYSEEIFKFMGIWDKLNEERKITFGSNVREVLSQVSEGAVDCGIVYSTDAAVVDNIEIIASAPEGSHKAITYPAAALKTSKNKEAAEKFIEYLKTAECTEVFEKAGFIINR